MFPGGRLSAFSVRATLLRCASCPPPRSCWPFMLFWLKCTGFTPFRVHRWFTPSRVVHPFALGTSSTTIPSRSTAAERVEITGHKKNTTKRQQYNLSDKQLTWLLASTSPTSRPDPGHQHQTRSFRRKSQHCRDQHPKFNSQWTWHKNGSPTKPLVVISRKWASY